METRPPDRPTFATVEALVYSLLDEGFTFGEWADFAEELKTRCAQKNMAYGDGLSNRAMQSVFDKLRRAGDPRADLSRRLTHVR